MTCRRTNGRRRSIVAACALCLAAPLVAVQAAGDRAPRLLVEAAPELHAAAVRVMKIPRDRLAVVVDLVGLTAPGPPIRILLAPEASRLASRVPAWIAGFAVPSESYVVVFPARALSYPNDDLEELVRHEVAHVLIDRAAGGREVPRWFDEGLATVAGGAWNLEDRGRLVLALTRGGEPPFAALDDLFSRGHAAAATAYALSAAFVRDLLERHGRDAPAALFAAMRRGADFATAFRGATGESLEAAEAEFWRRATFWDRWVPLLTSSLVLWIGVTLLAVVAIVRRRRRDAALRERWAQEERIGARQDGSGPES